MTVAELIVELGKMRQPVTTYVMDDQGFPHEITGVRDRADINVVTIESASGIAQTNASQQKTSATRR